MGSNSRSFVHGPLFNNKALTLGRFLDFYTIGKTSATVFHKDGRTNTSYCIQDNSNKTFFLFLNRQGYIRNTWEDSFRRPLPGLSLFPFTRYLFTFSFWFILHNCEACIVWQWSFCQPTFGPTAHTHFGDSTHSFWVDNSCGKLHFP